MEDIRPLSQSHFLKVRVQNICCAKEAHLINDNLQNVDGILKVSVNVIGRQAYITHDESIISSAEIVKRLNSLHLGVSVIEKGQDTETGVNRKSKITLSLKIINLMILTVLFVAVLAVNLKSRVGRIILVPLLTLGSIPLVLKTFIDFRRCVLINVNLLMLIATVGTLVMDELLDSIIIVYVFSVAELIEYGCRYKVEKDIAAASFMLTLSTIFRDQKIKFWYETLMYLARCCLGLIQSAPEKAVLAETNETVNIENVPIGTLLMVCAGERIPLDGEVMKGKSSVDESSITGESTPVSKAVGDVVFSGSIVQSGFLKIKTTCDSSTSTSSQVKRLVEEAQSQTTKQAELIDKFVRYFTPGIIILAAIVVFVPFVVYETKKMQWDVFHLWCIRGLVILLVACPCSIIMATPVPMICGITNAAKIGALVKGGVYLERLSQLNLMIFDKTGTLTEGKFRVTHEYCEAPDRYDETLEMAAALETKSIHHLAACIVNHYSGCITDKIDEHGNSLNLPDIQKFKNVNGLGVTGVIKERKVVVGSKKMMMSSNISLSHDMLEKAAIWSNEGYTLVFAAVDGKSILLFALADNCRASSNEAIRSIQELGISCVMLTGDAAGPAERIRKQVGIKTCFSSMNPNDKYLWILNERNKKNKNKNITVAMVGDGINDCPSLALSDVGVAIGPSAAALAINSADISLMSDNLIKIAHLIQLSKHCRRVVLQNLFLAAFIKVCFVFAALFYKDALWLAVLADMLGLLTVSANGIRPLYWKSSEDTKPRRSSVVVNHFVVNDSTPLIDSKTRRIYEEP